MGAARQSANWRTIVASFAVLLGLASECHSVSAQTPPPKVYHAFKQARDEMRRHPHDAYLQYVALQTATRADVSSSEWSSLVEYLPPFQWRRQRNAGPDLFSIFSGQLAVQESLQLDTILDAEMADANGRFRVARAIDGFSFERGEQLRKQRELRRNARVKLDSLVGPTIKSHPWTKMLGDKRPEISALARCVPDDFYFIEFHSVGKLLDLLESGDVWGRHLSAQSSNDARTKRIAERLKRQLAIETNPLARPFYDQVVEELGVTGSDLFVGEGSDVTLLFRYKQPLVFQTQMQLFLTSAQATAPNARRSELTVQGVRCQHVTSDDRSVHVFTADPQPGLHLRSNSLAALRRVLGAIKGQDEAGKPVTRLGDTHEFAYIRTLMPRGAEEEDGFVYLSDPFIRNIVGPKLKLTEHRRLGCYNCLRMLGHAALLYRTEQGKAPQSIADLVAAGCAPAGFRDGRIACPHGGKLELTSDGMLGSCSVHGPADSLIPNLELPLDEVDGYEADQYREFLSRYNDYWRTFFDPIAVRVQVRPEQYRVETIVLPLIENSIYKGLAEATAGEAVRLESLPTSKRNILSVALHLDKQHVARQLRVGDAKQETAAELGDAPWRSLTSGAKSLRRIGEALHEYHDDRGQLPTDVSYDAQGAKRKLSWRVHLLPYLGEEELFKQFRLDEPWDSDTNKGLIKKLPEVYRPDSQKLADDGRTRIVAPTGKQTVFPATKAKVGLTDVTDGASRTIMLVEADDEHAVVWTKPDDLPIDESNLTDKLYFRKDNNRFLALHVDGSRHTHPKTMEPSTLAALLTRNGGETVTVDRSTELLDYDRESDILFGLSREDIKSLGLMRVIADGIGDVASLHFHDSDQLFSLNLASLLGQTAGVFGAGNQRFDETMAIGALIGSFNSPVSWSIPVRDRAIVDDFLTRLDKHYASRFKTPGWGFITLNNDYYRTRLGPRGEVDARTLAIQVGPIKWRVFWARIDDGLFLATKPDLLVDMFEQTRAVAKEPPPAERPTDKTSVGHAMVRLRPENWNQVLPNFRLGWAENERIACEKNLVSLSNIARSLPAEVRSGPPEKAREEVDRQARRIFDSHFFCPDGGRYSLSPDGRSMECDHHGANNAPRQPAEPSKDSQLGQLLNDLGRTTATLTLQEDGLHAVLTIERPKRDKSR